MEATNLLIYIILIIVLVSLIGVSVWLLYDYNNLKTQLKGEFKTIGNSFSTHKTKDNKLEGSITTNSTDITKNKTELTESIEAVKKDLTESVKNTNDKHDKDFMAFNENLNKYFTFGTDGASANADSDSIFKWFTFDDDNGNKLELIRDTIIASELTIDGGAKLKTDSDKKLKVCDIDGASCFDIYRRDDDLIIKTPDTGGKIIIGGGTPDNSLVIESGNLKFNGNLVHHAGSPHTHEYSRTPLAHTHDAQGIVTEADVVQNTTAETTSAGGGGAAAAVDAAAAAAAAAAALLGV